MPQRAQNTALGWNHLMPRPDRAVEQLLTPKDTSVLHLGDGREERPDREVPTYVISLEPLRPADAARLDGDGGCQHSREHDSTNQSDCAHRHHPSATSVARSWVRVCTATPASTSLWLSDRPVTVEMSAAALAFGTPLAALSAIT